MVFDSISPSPQGIKIKKLTHRGQRAYVFEVPRSPYAPHQVKEKGAYWFRFNATTKPAPHHFVEALMRRVRFPDLGVHLRMGHVQRLEKRRSISVGFDVVCMNRSVLQNEQDITVSIHVSHGRIKEMGGGSNLELGSQSRTLVISNARDLLHHGIDFRVSIQVDIPFKGIEPPEKLRVQLGVAGRFSPIKYSEYLVQVSDIHDLPADQLSKAIKTDVLFDSEAEGPTRLEASHFNRRFH
ncbi:MAG: hypothetical protein IPI81_09425 [Flavobacteriales bacterium]|nr:hypothetical protein [Flavobacteriales bacterium]